MTRSRSLPSALLPSVLAGAVALPLAVIAAVPAAVALDRSPARTELSAAERAQAELHAPPAVAERLAEERSLARDVRTEQRAAAERAAAERAAAEAAARAAAEAAERAAAERRDAEARASRSRRTPSGSPQAIASAMLAERGQADQFGCLDQLWTKESGWEVSAANSSSGAYGIPQALPGSKMASVGSDWRTNPATQIRWGLGYIADRYGSPCAAWRHSQARNWY